MSPSNSLLRTIFVCLLVCLARVGHASSIILDQQYIVGETVQPSGPFSDGLVFLDNYLGGYDLLTAQTFTVGVAGQLTGVDLQIGQWFGSGGNVTIGIYQTDGGGTPTGSALASQSVPYDSLPAFTFGTTPFSSFDFSSAGLLVTPDQLLAIVAQADSTAQSAWSVYAPGAYSGGIALSTYGDGSFQPYLFYTERVTGDFGFKTYVEPAATAVPEPIGALLLGPGLVGWLVRRRNRL